MAMLLGLVCIESDGYAGEIWHDSLMVLIFVRVKVVLHKLIFIRSGGHVTGDCLYFK